MNLATIIKKNRHDPAATNIKEKRRNISIKKDRPLPVPKGIMAHTPDDPAALAPEDVPRSGSGPANGDTACRRPG